MPGRAARRPPVVRRLAAVVGGTLVEGGSASTLTISNPGDTAEFSFSGTAGDDIYVQEIAHTLSDLSSVTLYDPDGLQVGSTFVLFQDLDKTHLTKTGTWRIDISPWQSGTGTVTMKLFGVAADASATASLGGSAVTVTTTTPGQNAQINFNATAGQDLYLEEEGHTLDDQSTVTIHDQNGALVGSSVFLFQDLDKTHLTLGGSYTATIDGKGASTGSATVQLFGVPADATASASLGGPAVTVTTTTPGQNAQITFTGTQGQSVYLEEVSHTLDDLSAVTVTGPNGQQASFFLFQDLDKTKLTQGSGTYMITIDGHLASTGSATIQLFEVPADAGGVLAIGGSSGSATTTTIGQNVGFSFYAAAGQPVQLVFSHTVGSLGRVTVTAPAPNGSVVVDAYEFQGPFTFTAPVAGVYTLLDDAYQRDTGTDTAALNPSAPYEPAAQTYGTCNGKGRNALAASVCTADPVNSLTGAFTDSETDLSLAATGIPFAFTRSYTSADPTAGRLGPGWTDNYAASLLAQANGDVLVHGDDGQQVYYAKQADGSFLGAAGALSALTSIVGGYKLVTHDQVAYAFNSNGVLQSELDRNGQGLTFGYDGSGRLATITDTAAHAITLGYNGSNLLSSVSVPGGRAVGYGYTNGRLTSVTLPDPDGAGGPLTSPIWTYTYDANGRLWQVIDPNLHTQATNIYDPTTGRVTQQTDANQKTTLFAWDDPTHTATITDPDNHIWKDVYDQNNVLIKRIDPAGDVTQLGHDLGLDTNAVTAPNGTDTTSLSFQNGNLMQATAPASLGGVQKTFTYDAQNNVKTVTDARNKLNQYGYDLAGNNNSITLDGQQVFGATYNAQGQMLTSTDGNQKQSTYTYDAAGNVASVTAPDPDGAGPLAASKTIYTYDAMGNVLTKVDPLGNCSGCTPANYTTSYTYDSNGHLLTETDPLGHTTAHTYDAAGNQASVKDANNHTTTYGYDSANHLLQVTGADPDGAGPLEAPITKYSYDDAGNRLTMIGPRGNCSGCTPATYTTTYTYDQNNRLASAITPKGEKTTYSYDTNGNLATTVDPRGNVQGANPDDYKTSYSYDAAGRMLTTTDPLAHVTTNHYDPVGNLDWTKDANLHQTSYTYDAAGRILTVTAPDTGLTTSTYDGNGNLQTRKDDNNHVTSYAYDNAERLTTITGPGVSPPLTTYTYDLNGNVASTTDPNGNATQTAGDGTTTDSYDHANRLTGIGYSDSTPPVGYGYDSVGNRTSMSDGSGSVTYVYDNLNRLTSATRGTNTFSYAYDVAGNISSRTYPDTTQTSYTYDEDNRLASATTGGTTTSYTYDPASHLAQTTLPSANGYLETRSYDHTGRLTEVKNAKGASVLSDFVSTLDPVGNPTQVVQTGASPATQTYSYDTNDRILSVCFQAGTCPNASDPKISWSYDKVGNRLTETRTTTTTTDSYNAVDELTQTSTQNTGPNPYSGQVVADGAQPYWRLGETSGTSFASTVGSYTGAWTGSPTLAVPGALTGDSNTAVTLNGTGQSTQYGTVTNAAGLNKTNNFSLELWVKRSSARTGVLQAIAGKPLTTTTKSENYALWLTTANKPQFEVGAGTGTKFAVVTSSTAISDTTTWHHLVGTFASGVLKIYLDGTLVGTNSAAGFTSVVTNTSTFDLGRSGTTNYFSGSIDEIALYGTALTGIQIADHNNKAHNAPTTVSYGYDNNGNQTAAGTAALTYDLANRLKTYASGGTTTTYSYDGDNNRLQASTGTLASQKTNYLWDTNQPLPQLALERDGNNTLLRRYTYGASRISMTSGGNAYYYHYDPLGSVANLTNGTGATEWTDSYEPYGAVHAETKNDPNAPTNLFKFAGEQSDPTGLNYLRAREYDPTTGRFTQQDQIDPPPMQPYTGSYIYVADRPTNMVDPSGMTLLAPSDAPRRTLEMAASPADSDTEGACGLGCQILRTRSITLYAGQRSNIIHDLTTPGIIHPKVFRGILGIAKTWPIEIEVLKTGHTTPDASYNHSGGWAVDLLGYTNANYLTTTRFMKWLFFHRSPEGITQIIGANPCWVYPNYFDSRTLGEHKNHVHLSFGPAPAGPLTSCER
jgi:RHS repeat-associated protein